MAAPLQYLLMPLKVVALEKVIQKILTLFVHTLPPRDKHYLLNRHNLAQHIQMQLFQKQKTFAQLFLAF